jgi:DNA-binding response OmpR family regulator
MTKRHILIVEDDAVLAQVLRDNLVYEGFDVECVTDGAQAVDRARDTRPDLVLLDVMIPELNGFEVCRTLHASRDRLPIIILSARSQKTDKVRGLELGADDYITKPFSFDELLARVHAVLRRTSVTVQTLSLGSVRIDFGQMRAWKQGSALALTSHEFGILQHLAERAGRVVSREELLRAVWGYVHTPVTRTVDNFVARLRRKIEPDPHHPRFIQTIHGDGYQLVSNDIVTNSYISSVDNG